MHYTEQGLYVIQNKESIVHGNKEHNSPGQREERKHRSKQSTTWNNHVSISAVSEHFQIPDTFPLNTSLYWLLTLAAKSESH